MIENVIFLGAGASKAEEAPVQGQLFKKYFSSSYNAHTEMNERLYDFFKDFFSIDVENSLDADKFPTFEEILGILELSINREESFKYYGINYNNPKIHQIKEDLIFLIGIVLDKELENRDATHHKRLVDRLIEENNIKKTSFISLNYDILLDNVLTDIKSTNDLDLDYGIEFTNFEQDHGPDRWRRPLKRKSIQVYKPHGSLNWLYCPTCISTTLTPKMKGGIRLYFEPKRCKNCGSNMIPIIIPPTFFKVMSNRYLQEIWYKSENALKTAKKIYFCGYSFPDADIHIKYLLKRAELNTYQNHEIYIINNSDDARSRYERFFKNKVNWVGISFEEFCTSGI